MVDKVLAETETAGQPARWQRKGVRIAAYETHLQPVFKSLNLEWISKHWTPEPAITLYRKSGFREIEAQGSPYQRANVFIRLAL